MSNSASSILCGSHRAAAKAPVSAAYAGPDSRASPRSLPSRALAELDGGTGAW